MELISEKTISDLYKSGSLVSGITQKALTKRLNSGNSRIELHSAIVNIKKKFIELIFYVASTSGNTEFIAATDLPQPKNGYYTVVVRFYDTDKYILTGIVSMLLFQQIQNIGMTIGLLPITGITLPFISYGGSSLLSYMIMIGIILNISMEKNKKYWSK